MKVSTIIMMVLFVGFLFAAVGLLIGEMEQQYVNTDVDTSFVDKYNYTSQIEDDVEPLRESFDNMGQSTSWTEVITGSLNIFFTALLDVPSIIFGSILYANNIISGFGNDIGLEGVGIPQIFISIAITLLLVYVVFKVVSWWHRSDL